MEAFVEAVSSGDALFFPVSSERWANIAAGGGWELLLKDRFDAPLPARTVSLPRPGPRNHIRAFADTPFRRHADTFLLCPFELDGCMVDSKAGAQLEVHRSKKVIIAF